MCIVWERCLAVFLDMKCQTCLMYILPFLLWPTNLIKHDNGRAYTGCGHESYWSVHRSVFMLCLNLSCLSPAGPSLTQLTIIAIYDTDKWHA